MKSTKRDIQRLNRLSIVFVTRVYCKPYAIPEEVLALKHVQEDPSYSRN